MKKIITLGAISLVASAILVGCGSSSSSDDSSVEYLDGYFIDAAVANCEYETTSGKHGRTDKDGKFQYKKGDKVKFSLGGLSLGEAKPAEDGLVTPKSLTVDEESKVRLLRVLQSLDSDNNPSNGITISDEVITSLEKWAQERNGEVKIADISDIELINIDDNLKKHLDSDSDGELDVDAQKAQNHFEESIQNWHGDKNSGSKGHGKGKGNGNNDNSDNNSNNGDNGSDETTNSSNGKGHGDGDGFNIEDTPKTEGGLTQEVIESLAYMGNEERLAYDIYTTLYDKHDQSIKQFYNISHNSEIKHVGIVQDLVRRYNIDITKVQNVSDPVATKDIAFEDMPTGKYDVVKIQELYDMLYDKGIKSKQDALEVGCMVEVVDVNDLDKYIEYAKNAGADDIVEGFEKLRSGSYNHYWSFDRGLKKIGVSEGCGVLGSDYIKDYPQNEKGHNHDN
jgi:hypothetical protein